MDRRFLILCGGLLLAGLSVAQTMLPLLGAGGGGAATFTYIGGASGFEFTTRLPVTVTYSPTNGNLVVADLMCADDTSTDLPSLTTDNGTSTWTNLLASGQFASHYFINEDYTLSAAGSPTVFTGHCGSMADAGSLLIREYNRSSGSWVAGTASAIAAGIGSPATGGSVTAAGHPALISGVFINLSNETAWTSSSPYTTRLDSDDFYNGVSTAVSDFIVVSASGTYSAAAAITGTPNWRAFSTWYK